MSYKTLIIKFNDGTSETIENVTEYKVHRFGAMLVVRTQVSDTYAEKRFYSLSRIDEYKEEESDEL